MAAIIEPKRSDPVSPINTLAGFAFQRIKPTQEPANAAAITQSALCVSAVAYDIAEEHGTYHIHIASKYNPLIDEEIKSFTQDEHLAPELEKLRAIGGEEIAPKAEFINEESVKRWRAAGFGVRAWGVFSPEIMKAMCELGVDGMTVNFPDKLHQYLKSE